MAIRPLASGGAKLKTYYDTLRSTTLSYSPESVKVCPLTCVLVDSTVPSRRGMVAGVPAS